MNVRLKKKNDSNVDYSEIKRLAEKFSIHPKAMEVLFLRGFDDEEKLNRFLFPTPDNLYDPFLMKNMGKITERIERAIAENELVAVYGDYDADGVCASAVLSLYLRSRGIRVYTHIPDRISEGYGLNIPSLEKIIERINPDLIITVDCGISGYSEVEYALDLGVDVIVTDHHEVPEKIPSCLVLNPKQPDCDYPFDGLCGAGVALKLVEALGGRKAMLEYIDLAAVATVADLVPLSDENRLIVRLGLKAIAEGKNIALKHLLADLEITGAPTSSDIAYKLAPRINAAGRIGDAYRAYEMLISDDVKLVKKIIDEINEANTKRKAACDKLYFEALSDIKKLDLTSSRCIILGNPEWEKGITGIVAARISGEFKRPAVILVPAGESVQKGTCRSVEGVNIYEALSSVSDLLIEYGGHSGAAGFAIENENVPEFTRRMNEYLSTFDDEYFLPSCTFDVEIDSSEVNFELVKSLEKLEPTGCEFTSPLFKITEEKLSVAYCKNNVKHTTFTTQSGLQILAFNFFNKNHYALGEGKKEIIAELQLSKWGGKEGFRAVLKEIVPENLFINDETARAVCVGSLRFAAKNTGKAKYTEYGAAELKQIVGEDIYGTLTIGFDGKDYEKYNAVFGKGGAVVRDYMYFSGRNNYNRIIIAPDFEITEIPYAYKRIVFLERPLTDGVLDYIAENTNAEIFLPREDGRARFIDVLDTSRETLGRYYDYIRSAQDISASNVYAYLKSVKSRIPEANMSQFMLALCIFSELGLITEGEEKYKPETVKGARGTLSESAILAEVNRLKTSL